MNIRVTDDLKIMTKQAIIAYKDNNLKAFENSLIYLLKNIKDFEIKPYINYLYNKLKEQQ